MHHMTKTLDVACEALGAGRRAAFCAVVSTHGSTPQIPGAALVLCDDASISGTLGGGCVEAEVRKKGLELLAGGESRVLNFDLDHDYGWDDGLICGGRLDVAIASLREEDLPRLEGARDRLRAGLETSIELRVEQDGRSVAYELNYEAVATLHVAGAGHVGLALASLARELDFAVRVYDDRSDLLSAERFPDPIERCVGPVAGLLGKLSYDWRDYVVIVTRGHRHDAEALRAVIDTPAGYVGMIGSKRKRTQIYQRLEADGIRADRLAGVHCPVGLDIGAITVPEIAVSIAAELVAVRRVGKPKPQRVRGPLPLAR